MRGIAEGAVRALYAVVKRRDRRGGESMNRRTFLGGLLAAGLALAGADAQENKSLVSIPEQIQFNRDVRPILSENCVKCHGPGTRKGNLRLDLRESAFAPAESGKVALVPGDLAKSELWQRIS